MSNSMSYEELLNSLRIKEKKINDDYKVIIPINSWYFESISILEGLICSIKNKESLINSEGDEDYWNKIFTSLAFLKQLDQILDVISYLKDENLKIFLSKLKIVFKAPLLMSNEDENTSQGRNTLFELSLFSKFAIKGLEVKLHFGHPDISVRVGDRLYVIECKRLQKPDTLLKNIKRAIKQLKIYSLNKENKAKNKYKTIGLVAISLERFIHNGDKLFEAKSELVAQERIYFEIDKIIYDNEKDLLSLLSVEIPGVIFEYYDRGSIDKPYSFDFITVFDSIAVSTGCDSILEKDFKNLKS